MPTCHATIPRNPKLQKLRRALPCKTVKILVPIALLPQISISNKHPTKESTHYSPSSLRVLTQICVIITIFKIVYILLISLITVK